MMVAACQTGSFAPSGLTCRLPISYRPDEGGTGVGFVDIPNGKLQPAIDAFESTDGDATYDEAVGKWLPVARRAVSPDGARYAVAEQVPLAQERLLVNQVRVVDVKTGSTLVFEFDRLRFGTAVPSLGVVLFGAQGIYLTEGYDATRGLWLMNDQTGDTRKLAAVDLPQVVAGDVVWFGRVNPLDGHPVLVPDFGHAPDEVMALNLRDGSSLSWLYRPGEQLWVVGLDQFGAPLVLDYPDEASEKPVELLSVRAPQSAASVTTFELKSQTDYARPMTDSHGTWFGSSGGIYLYTSDHKLRKVSDVAGQPAGACV